MPIDPKGPTPKPQVWEVKPSDTVRTMRIGGSRKPKDTLADAAPKTVLSTQVISEEEQARISAAAAQAIPAVGTVPQTKAESPTLVGMEAPVASRNKFTAPATGTLNQVEVMNTGDIVGGVTSDPAIPVPQNPTVDIRSKQEEPPHVDLGQNDSMGNQPKDTPWDGLRTRVMPQVTLDQNRTASMGPNLSAFDEMHQELFPDESQDPGVQTAQGFGMPETVVPEARPAAQPQAEQAVPAIDPALAPDPSQGPVEELPKKSKKPVGGIGSEFGLGVDDFPPESESIGSDTVLNMAPESERRERAETGDIIPLFTHLEALVGKLQKTLEDELKGLGDQRTKDEKRNDEVQRALNQEWKNIKDCMAPLVHATTARQDQMNTTILQNVERIVSSINALGIDATRETLQEIVTEVGNLKNTVSALQLTVNDSRADVSKTLESQSRAEIDIKGLRDNQNAINTAFGELKSATEATLSSIEKKMGEVEKIQKDAYTLASETKFNTEHVRNDVQTLVNEVKAHVDAKVNVVLESERVLREKVEAMPGLNSDVAGKLNLIEEAVKVLVKEAAKPKPPVREASPQPATPVEPSAPAPAAQAAAAAQQPQAPAAPAAPPAPPPQTPPTPPTPPAQATAPAATPQPRRRNWGFRHGIAAGVAAMLLMVSVHACGADDYGSNDRMVFSTIEGGTVTGRAGSEGRKIDVTIGDVKTALWGIAAQETGNKHNPEQVADLDWDIVFHPELGNDEKTREKAIGPALGKYGLMKAYWKEWASKAGVNEEYLDPEKYIERDPKTKKPLRFGIPDQIQLKVATYHFEDLLKQERGDYEKAIRRWNPGEPTYFNKVGEWVAKKDGAK